MKARLFFSVVAMLLLASCTEDTYFELKDEYRPAEKAVFSAFMENYKKTRTGKSTFINRLAKRKATVTGNRPGVTKSQQIIKVDKDFELFDTPGVLWPKFESENIARNIALIGSIKQQILPREELFVYAVEYLVNHYPGMIEKRYGITVNLDTDWIEKCYDDIAISRKIKPVRAMTDYDRVMDVFFNDLFDGLMGNITWEKPHD